MKICGRKWSKDCGKHVCLTGGDDGTGRIDKKDSDDAVMRLAGRTDEKGNEDVGKQNCTI